MLTFSVQRFKCHVFAMARALFTLNANCEQVVSLSHEKDLHLMGHYFTHVSITGTLSTIYEFYVCPVYKL